MIGMTEFEKILAMMTPAERRMYRQMGGVIPPHLPRTAPEWHAVTGAVVRRSRPESIGSHPGRGGRVLWIEGFPPFASAAEAARHFGLREKTVRMAVHAHGRVTPDGSHLPAKVLRGMLARSRRKAKRAA